jgi:hypothetical protein
MSTEKMREEFEVAFKKEFGFDWEETTPVTDDDRAAVMEVALWAWMASRAALVIELPDASHYDGHQPALAIDDCRQAIEAAGVKVKP